ncbi:hypothetical protein LCGC14_2346340 [marine sediment metagenome]|uniref:Uncharacterized protein n=1 Tax=marine sediment metagenome TaxID=412755 RepID=A0A0F9CY27_9ZZZZ
MRKNLCMFATLDDLRAFREFVRSIDLRLLPSEPGEFSPRELQAFMEDPTTGGYFSFLPLGQLHLYGRPPVKISDATDPLIFFVPPRYDPPNLIAGQIQWTGRHSKFGVQTKPYYAKLWRWVDKNWTKRLEDAYYLGPEAARLAEEDETQLYYFPPGIEIQKVAVPDIRQARRDRKKRR